MFYQWEIHYDSEWEEAIYSPYVQNAKTKVSFAKDEAIPRGKDNSEMRIAFFTPRLKIWENLDSIQGIVLNSFLLNVILV